MTTLVQEQNHKAAIAAAEGARQTAIATAKQAYDNSPAAWPAFNAAIKAADIANVRAIIASCEANGLQGPRQMLHDLTGSYT